MSRPFTRSQAHGTNAEKITERLPPEILVLICQAVEESPPDGRALVLHKHDKIRTILQIKNTCKSWYLRIVTAKLLFREIVFHTTNSATVETAQACLRLLGRGSKIPLHLFIAGSEGDMDKFTRLLDKVTRLFKLLSRFGPNIVRCQVWDPSDKMCDILKSRASTLEYLCIGTTGRTSVFSGPLPSLRTMVLATSNSKLWNAGVFPVLSNLSLTYAGDSTETSLRSLIHLLQSLPQLENLHLNSFRHWVSRDGFLPTSGLVSTVLRKISFTNCDFSPVLQYVCAPNLQSFIIYGIRPNDGTTSLPFFQDPALFWHVQAIPILEKPQLRNIAAIARQGPTKRFLSIEISGNGLRFSVRLEWFRWIQDDWERWVNNSCRDLLQRARFSTMVSLAIDFDQPSIATLCPAFSSLVCVKALAVVGDSLCELLLYLRVSDYPTYQLRFPALRLLDLMTYETFTPQEGNQIRSYLQFRVHSNASVRLLIRRSAWSEGRGCPWTSFMTANDFSPGITAVT